jgi:hypothetical protein
LGCNGEFEVRVCREVLEGGDVVSDIVR